MAAGGETRRGNNIKRWGRKAGEAGDEEEQRVEVRHLKLVRDAAR